MHVFIQGKIKYDGILDNSMLRIVVKENLKNNEIIGDTWYLTASTRTPKYLLSDDFKHKSRLHSLDYIGAFLQANVKHTVFINFDSRYGDYFPEYFNYIGSKLRLKKSMYGMNISEKRFPDELLNCV